MKYKLAQHLSTQAENCIQDILRARGVENIQAYMYPTNEWENDAHKLEHIDEAAQKLIEHLKKDSKIVVIVDADCDGNTSAAILWNYIKHFFPASRLRYICHEHKGHGLEDLIDELETHDDINLVLVPDAGSFDSEYYKRLQDIGAECICLDHHDAPEYPTDCICVNNQLSPDYPNKSLCGAGVVYKFCQVLDEYLSPEEPHAPDYLDLVALAEIGDCMSPANPETRYYIYKGLQKINNAFFRQLITEQSFSMFKTSREINYIKVAFYIAPLINAVVRVGTMEEKRYMFRAFIDPEAKIPSTKRGIAAGTLLNICDEMARRAANAKSRQNRVKDKATALLESRVQKEGLLDNKILVIEVYDEDDIPQELRGLIAAQFVNKYHRPTLIGKANEEGFLRGSIRGNDSFEEVPDLKTFLLDSGFMESVTGHSNAAGYSIKKAYLPDLLDYANTHISDQGLENVYNVDYVFDANDDFTALGLALAQAEKYWGNEIREPTVVIKDIPLTDIRYQGEKKDTVKITHNGVGYLKFKDDDFAQIIEHTAKSKTSMITIYGKFNANSWAGKTSLQIFINDYDIRDSKWDF